MLVLVLGLEVLALVDGLVAEEPLLALEDGEDHGEEDGEDEEAAHDELLDEGVALHVRLHPHREHLRVVPEQQQLVAPELLAGRLTGRGVHGGVLRVGVLLLCQAHQEH